MGQVFRAFWLYLVTLRARWRASRLQLAFVRCPVCRRPFCIDEVWGTPGGPPCLMHTPHSGITVCKNCQEIAVERNRAAFGRDMIRDPYPPGMRIEP